MAGIRSLAKSASALRPFVVALRGVEKVAAESAAIAVVDGEPAATARLRAILGVDGDQPLDEAGGVLIYAAVEGHDRALATAVLAGAKRDGRTVLAIIVGPRGVRERMEREIVSEQPLEPANVAHVADLDDPGPVCAAVANLLGEHAIPLARRHPALRDAVAEIIISRSARQAGAAGAAGIIPGSDLPAITLIQVRMVAQLAALAGRPLDRRRGIEIAGVVLSAFGWRAVARRVATSVPVAGFALRGGIGYSATRATGEAVRAYFAQSGDHADQPLDGLQSVIKNTLSRRGRR